MNKQFQSAEDRLARFTVTFGSEFPMVSLKNLIARSQQSVPIESLPETLTAAVAAPEQGVLLA
jgi:histidyl-tRNA synthetase